MADNRAAMHTPSSLDRTSQSVVMAQFCDTVSRMKAAGSPTTPQKNEAAIAPRAAEPKGRVDISNLMSPPEPATRDNFVSKMTHAETEKKKQFPHPPLSPPVSPFAKSANVASRRDLSITIRDPVLYPRPGSAPSPPAPLFTPRAESVETSRLVDEHIASRPASLFRETTPPKREDYELALHFKSDVMKKFMEDPRGWLRKERELLRVDREDRRNAGMRTHKLMPLLPSRMGNKAIKPKAIPVKLAVPPRTTNPNLNRVQKHRTPKPKQPRAIRATPTPTQQSISVGVNVTPEPRVRTVAPNREDKDFGSLPDLCPPLDSLPNKQNSLKVDWKGNALDLSKDPLAYLLHPDELLLAGSLRLDCATYLTSKRRIFMRRLECAEIRKEFRKTDAQQACKIDVNKASKLWQAYEKVGWLNVKWMHKFMKPNRVE